MFKRWFRTGHSGINDLPFHSTEWMAGSSLVYAKAQAAVYSFCTMHSKALSNLLALALVFRLHISHGEHAKLFLIKYKVNGHHIKQQYTYPSCQECLLEVAKVDDITIIEDGDHVRSEYRRRGKATIWWSIFAFHLIVGYAHACHRTRFDCYQSMKSYQKKQSVILFKKDFLS